MPKEERVRQHDQRFDVLLGHPGEGDCQGARLFAHLHAVERHPQLLGCLLKLFPRSPSAGQKGVIMSTPTRDARGTASFSSSSHWGSRSEYCSESPVMFPLGRARLATWSPALITMTIGMVLVVSPIVQVF